MAIKNKNWWRRYAVLAHDVSVILLSYVVAFVLRVGTVKISDLTNEIVLGLLVLGICAIPFLFASKIHRSMWQYFSIEDVKVINKNCLMINASFFIVMFIITRLENIPRSIFIIQHVLMLSGIIGPRFLYRMYTEKIFIQQNNFRLKKLPIIISGINHDSENFIRSVFKSQSKDYEVVAIIDDNLSKAGTRLYGIPVMGNIDNLENIVNHLNGKNIKPQKLLVADENADPNKIKLYIAEAEKYGMSVARLPNIMDFRASDNTDNKSLVIEDLLERPQNIVHSANLLSLMSNKKVMVTGGGGTIGGELVRQISNHNPSLVIVIDNSEFNLYNITKELSSRNIMYKTYICDVRNNKKIDAIFAENRPEIIFHAAALKHVPIAEENPDEAVTINFIGTENVATAAKKYNSELFVLISTDKAVNPTNIMGATKRMAEKFVASLSVNSATTFVTIRFGNVLGSSGSVIPLFEEQIRAGGPVTVTHPDIIRYFMTVRESVRLVLESAAIGSTHPENNGGIFVLNMGEPVKIYDLALRMIKMAGLRPDIDVEIKFTGLRPGEKLYEELFYQNENLLPTSHKDIMFSKINFDVNFNWTNFTKAIHDATSDAEIRAIISVVVPEFAQKIEKTNEPATI